MRRIYCNKETGMVEQIFDLSVEPELKDQLGENTFGFCYMVDVDDDTIEVGYDRKHNQETGEFEIAEDYVEVETVIEPSKVDVLGMRTDNIETELVLTQSAVDFLLMTSIDAMGINNKTLEKGERVMAGYLAMRIIRGMLSYKEVIAKYPEFKEDIDFILKAEGKGDLITP